MSNINAEIQSIKDACSDIEEKIYVLDEVECKETKENLKQVEILGNQINDILEMCMELDDFADKLGDIYDRAKNLREDE